MVSFSRAVGAACVIGAATAQWGHGWGNKEGHLPVVDLGYELHQAAYFNSTGGFYNFSNIRYAAPPLGNLRFAAPQPPETDRSSIQTGSVGRICPQADPAWLLIAEKYIPEYLAGQTVFNESSFANLTSSSSGSVSIDPRTTEDCLFLDVIVPQDIFKNAGHDHGAPVLVWIYGGGYTGGSKDGSGNPAGLIARSEANNSPGVIYVSLNYRLGAFGWLSGPSLQANGTANAGLYDQRLALEWVQQHISKFGGDPQRVTVFGESAGGGSIMHQMTAYGGLKGKVPFQQAVPQSPGFQPFVSYHQQEDIFNAYLSLLNVSTIQEARQLSSAALQTANLIQVGNSPYGGFTYGPVVDGDFVPNLPGLLLQNGEYDKSLNVMIGHNANEGLLFTSPFIQNNSAFTNELVSTLPTLRAWPNTVDYIVNTLYPPIFDGSQAQGYTNQIARYSAATAELIFTCNTFYIDKAYNNNTYSYFFSVPPALHGEDIPYTYYNGPSSSVIAPEIALALQRYITDFAETGKPNGPGVPYFMMYGENATVQDLNITGISEVMDPAANQRCNWWQLGLYA